MRVDVQLQWVKALRSGEYLQGKRYLKREGKHCCLGVLCDVLKLRETSSAIAQEFHFGGEVSNQLLPNKLVDILKLTAKEQAELVYLNDTVEAKFEEIATFIERFIPSEPTYTKIDFGEGEVATNADRNAA
jgi:hypothetical protein